MCEVSSNRFEHLGEVDQDEGSDAVSTSLLTFDMQPFQRNTHTPTVCLSGSTNIVVRLLDLKITDISN